MIRQSIKRQIVSIAVGLIVLMVVTAVLSMVLAGRVGHLLDELTERYIPAYGHLARMNIRSIERALALRQMVIAKTEHPPDEAAYADRQKLFESKGHDVELEAAAARKLITAIIDDTSTPSDNAALARLEIRIETLVTETRHHLSNENAELIKQLDAGKFAEAQQVLVRIDKLRDEMNAKTDQIRADMQKQVYAGVATVIKDQQRAIVISAVITAVAATLGLFFAILVSGGITQPVRRLLEGTREVEAGRLDGTVAVTTRDEIGQLSAAFNRMVEQLRQNERVRETFGRYIDPKIVEGLVDRPALALTEGQRRVMTVLFCDMKGFTSLSEGVTPQGLVKVMNCYLSIMSEPIREQRGIIDKYIGDAIMAYWGPPFVDEKEQAHLACLAAIEMTGRIARLRKELPELLGVRSIPIECDLRIGIATGEALVGSIGSEFMMSYTVMGDTVNLASRLENANKLYGSRALVSEATIAAAGAGIESREIDRVIVAGQTQPQNVYEIMGRKGALAPEQLALRTKYAEGLAAYRARDVAVARDAFKAALQIVPDDGPSNAMIVRIDGFGTNPPGETWDGSWQLDK
jgi:class 3 adenylate cyclase